MFGICQDFTYLCKVKSPRWWLPARKDKKVRIILPQKQNETIDAATIKAIKQCVFPLCPKDTGENFPISLQPPDGLDPILSGGKVACQGILYLGASRHVMHLKENIICAYCIRQNVLWKCIIFYIFALEIHRNLRNFGLEMHQYNWFLVWKCIRITDFLVWKCLFLLVLFGFLKISCIFAACF